MGNKLYVLGGGWDVLTVNTTFPITQHLALALSIRVPWVETNTKHNFELEIQHDDGPSVAKIAGQVEVGRPPGIPAGTDQRSQIAADIQLKLDKPGVYAIVVRLEGEEKRRTSFRVIGGQA